MKFLTMGNSQGDLLAALAPDLRCTALNPGSAIG